MIERTGKEAMRSARYRGGCLAAVCAALVCVFAVPGLQAAVERFPTPDFESGYSLPRTTQPAPRSPAFGYVDAAVLVVALGLGSYLALRHRTRRAVWLLMVFGLLYFGFWRRGCVCAIGAIQNVAAGLSDPGFPVPWVVLAFFLAPLFTALLFGRTFCGSVCPLGAIQDVVVWRPVKVPVWLARVLGLIPIAYLGAAVLYAVTGAGFMICRHDPFVGLFRLSAPAGMVFAVAVVLLVGMFVGRPYCRFLCPYGVLLGWLSRFSKWHVTITPDDCIECGLCADACPFGAIRMSPLGRYPEGRRKGRRRLAIVLVAAPLLASAGAGLGYALRLPLARAHRTVRLAEQVQREEAAAGSAVYTEESLAFRASGQSVESLYAAMRAKRREFAAGGALLGAFLGLAVSGHLVAWSVRRRWKGCVADRGACLSCGRCFASCPRELERRRSAEESRAAATAETAE